MYTLSIAGFDPSGGAGVLADCKVFDTLGTIGLGITTSLTFQNENEFDDLQWLSREQLILQLTPLLRKYTIEFVKIGLIQDLDTLSFLVQYLKEYNQDIKIIWDPILKASAGFSFHENVKQKQLEEIAQALFLITPNWQEIQQLYPQLSPEEAGQYLSTKANCSVLLKGGHCLAKKGTDILYWSEKNETKELKGGKLVSYEKHGSGCVLSSAITAYLSQENDLCESIILAKEYITNYLDSTPHLLGLHR